MVPKCEILDRSDFHDFYTIFARVVDTGGKFATGVNDTGGKFATGGNGAGGK